MNALLYWLGKVLVTSIQMLPLRMVARLGRMGGALAWKVDRRHRAVAIDNLTACFGKERSADEIHELAREHFKRLGETYCCAIKTAGMSDEGLRNHLEIVGRDKLQSAAGEFRSAVFAVGHFGNFELYPHSKIVLPGFQFASTYRALNQRGLNRLLLELRQGSGAWLFERRMDGDALRAAMTHQKLILGLLSDQHAGQHGVWLPFFGRECSTTTAPAVFALRYKLPLYTAICYRTALARWQIEVGDEIPTIVDGQRRDPAAIMLDVNRAFEAAIRRDPANWFWVHKRWKPGSTQGRKALAAAKPNHVSA
jgi:lauroyl/myristoyl acyltransferase